MPITSGQLVQLHQRSITTASIQCFFHTFVQSHCPTSFPGFRSGQILIPDYQTHVLFRDQSPSLWHRSSCILVYRCWRRLPAGSQLIFWMMDLYLCRKHWHLQHFHGSPSVSCLPVVYVYRYRLSIHIFLWIFSIQKTIFLFIFSNLCSKGWNDKLRECCPNVNILNTPYHAAVSCQRSGGRIDCV